VEELAERAGDVMRRGVIAGTTVFRSHVDVDSVIGLRAVEGVARARAAHTDICDVEIVAFPQLGIVADPGTDELMAEAMRCGADVVGGMPHWEHSVSDARTHIEVCFRIAAEHDADVDMHVDETDDPASRTLELLVEATAAHGWQGRVTAGHCCSMAAWPDDYARHVIEAVADAGVNVITNPATNLMLQGRQDHEPRRRGIARVKELLAAGVTVGSGQDNLEDAFYPFGKADQLLLAYVCAHAAQLVSEPEIASCLAMIREGAAQILRLERYGLVEGARADIVVLDAATPLEALSRQAARRWVVRAGRVAVETRVESALIRA
jgi:cytosine deaminase